MIDKIKANHIRKVVENKTGEEDGEGWKYEWLTCALPRGRLGIRRD
jgi:hypothetical protein